MKHSPPHRRVAFIRGVQQSGFTLAEIKSMLRRGRAGAVPRQLWQTVATAKLAVIDHRIAALHACRATLEKKLTCRCRTLAQCERELAKEALVSPGGQLQGAK